MRSAICASDAGSPSTRTTSTRRLPTSRGSPAAAEVRTRWGGVPLLVMTIRSSSTERSRAGAPASRHLREVPRETAEDVRASRMGQRSSGQHSSMAIATERSEVLLALEPRPESARLARRALASQGLHEDVEHTVTLLATEIVGNAVRHAGLRGDQRIVFFARLAEDYARVEVADQGDGFDPGTVQTEGFALRLLSKPASRWGCDCTDRGCKVWFEVDRRSGRCRRAACARDHPAPGRSSSPALRCGKYLVHRGPRSLVFDPCHVAISASCWGLPP